MLGAIETELINGELMAGHVTVMFMIEVTSNSLWLWLRLLVIDDAFKTFSFILYSLPSISRAYKKSARLLSHV